MVECIKCHDFLIYDGSTSSMRKHLSNSHEDLFSKLVKTEAKVSASQPKISAPEYKISPISLSKKAMISNKILKFIACEMLPLRTVESSYFIDLLEVLEPRYSVPSRSTLTQYLLPNCFAQAKESLMKDVNGLKSFCFSFDFWTSLRAQSYLAVTIHYIKDDWSYNNYVLKVEQIDESHTGEVNAKHILEIFSEFNLKINDNSLYLGLSDGEMGVRVIYLYYAFFILK